jgi:hypothetical protein
MNRGLGLVEHSSAHQSLQSAYVKSKIQSQNTSWASCVTPEIPGMLNQCLPIGLDCPLSLRYCLSALLHSSLFPGMLSVGTTSTCPLPSCCHLNWAKVENCEKLRLPWWLSPARTLREGWAHPPKVIAKFRETDSTKHSPLSGDPMGFSMLTTQLLPRNWVIAPSLQAVPWYINLLKLFILSVLFLMKVEKMLSCLGSF